MSGTSPACVDSPCVPTELVREHMVMLRQLGGLQQRMDEVGRQHQQQLRRWQAENLRLRAELVLLRTSVFWGLGAAVAWHRPGRRRALPAPVVEAGTREAQAVICQTGCMGHAHPWLEADGQCRRSGQACERLPQGLDSEPV